MTSALLTTYPMSFSVQGGDDQLSDRNGFGYGDDVADATAADGVRRNDDRIRSEYLAIARLIGVCGLIRNSHQVPVILRPEAGSTTTGTVTRRMRSFHWSLSSSRMVLACTPTPPAFA